MITAVLFDIDNTLILFDERRFIHTYLSDLVSRFSDFFPPEVCRARIMAATNALVRNRGQKTNAEYYLDHFVDGTGADRSDIWRRFELFYQEVFPAYESLVYVAAGIEPLFRELSSMRLQLVAASNPFWPLAVQQIRLGWAGVGEYPYRYITHIENSSYCKPLPEYFTEISRRIGTPPRECLMVGNDPVNDMNAAKAGMHTYLTTDAAEAGLDLLAVSADIRSLADEALVRPDFEGRLSGVLDAVRQLSS